MHRVDLSPGALLGVSVGLHSVETREDQENGSVPRTVMVVRQGGCRAHWIHGTVYGQRKLRRMCDDAKDPQEDRFYQRPTHHSRRRGYAPV